MTRRGRRDTDGPSGQRPWPADEYGRRSRRADAAGDDDQAADYGPPDGYGPPWGAAPRGTAGHRAPGTSDRPGSPWDRTGSGWEETGPPWQVPGWDEADAALPHGHPSGPMPSVSSSGPQPAVSSPLPSAPGEPLAPLPPRSGSRPDWREPPVGGYPGDSAAGPRDLGPGYPGDRYPGGDGGYLDEGRDGRYQSRHGQDRYEPDEYAGSGYYDPGSSYPDHGSGHPDAGHPDVGGPGQPGPGYPDRDYGLTGDFTGDFTGDEFGYQGYGSDQDYPAATEYGDGYADAAFPGEPADPGYPGGGDYPDDQGDYPGYPGYPSGAGGVPAGDEGPGARYDSPGGWYEDVDDDHARVDEDYDDALLPGFHAGQRGRRAGGPPPYRVGPRTAGARRGGSGSAAGGMRKRGMRRAAPWIALTVVLLVFGGAGGAFLYVYTHYLHPADYSGTGYGTVEVAIKPGDTAAAVGQRLFAAGVVASARAFANAAKASGHGSGLQPGLYRLHKHMSAALAFSLLLSQKTRVQAKVVIPEGLRAVDIVSVLGRRTGEAAGYRQAIAETSKLGLPSYAHGNPEGYLFPATYEIQPGTPPLKVLQEMVAAFNREAASVSLPAAAAKGYMTPGQVITVASLVQAEGGKLSDFPKIAGVIYNRLNRNMPLQLDSSVLYGLHKYGFLATTAELRINTPYNTYLHKGLPPGPIDNPGDAAIRAALHPMHNPWLYFVTVNPKTRLTKFTSSYSQFLQYKAQLNAYLATHH